MSFEKQGLENGGRSDGSDDYQLRRNLTTVTLSPAQFESLYMQPKIAGRQYSLNRRFGNPTPLGISAFLLAHMPLSMDLMGFRGATAQSAVAMLGTFYACAGVGLYFACIMEWIMGNTFPSVVFGTFGGFWTAYGIIVTPTLQIAASFAPAADASNGITATMAGMMDPTYNVGLGLYFVVWGLMCLIYFVCALRTNVPFVLIFLSLVIAFELIAAGYFHTAQGNTSAAAMEFKVAGGFAFVTALAGVWIDISLLLASVGYPKTIPVIDLSSRFFASKSEDSMKEESKEA